MFEKKIRKSLVNSKLEVSLKCEDSNLEIKDCKTFIGLFNLGEIDISIPLRSVASCVIKRKINWVRSIYLIVVPFTIQGIIYSCTESDWFVPICLLLMTLGIVNLFIKDTYLSIRDNGGSRYDLSICFKNKNEAKDLIKEISKNSVNL